MIEIQDRVRNSIEKLNLGQNKLNVLIEIALDPHGLPKETAYTMIPRYTGVPDDLNNQMLITDLIADNYIMPVIDGGLTYLRANYEKLKIEKSIVERLFQIKDLGFEIIGYPHSPKAMQTLDDIFKNEKEVIYVALGITSYDVFKDNIEKRAKHSLKTVFFFPRKSTVPNNRIPHYNSILKSWRKYLNNMQKDIRQYIELRIADMPSEALYTTLYTKSLTRINIRDLGNVSSRKGTLLSISNGNAVYEIVGEMYNGLFRNSHPDILAHKLSFIAYFIQKYIFTIFLAILGGIFLILGDPLSTISHGLIIAIFANLITNWLGKKTWTNKKLY